MFKPSRRQLLFTALGAMSVLAARDFFLLYCRGVSRNVPAFFAGLDTQTHDAARTVGHRVARLYPGYGTQAALSRLLERRPLLLAAYESDCAETRQAMIQQQCCEDFSQGRTVIVDGWVVSQTEAQLCASIA